MLFVTDPQLPDSALSLLLTTLTQWRRISKIKCDAYAIGRARGTAGPEVLMARRATFQLAGIQGPW
jgi:hypothetical protein